LNGFYQKRVYLKKFGASQMSERFHQMRKILSCGAGVPLKRKAKGFA